MTYITVLKCSAWADIRRSSSCTTFLNKHATRWAINVTSETIYPRIYVDKEIFVRVHKYMFKYTYSLQSCAPWYTYMRYFTILPFNAFIQYSIHNTQKWLCWSILQQEMLKCIKDASNWRDHKRKPDQVAKDHLR